MKVSVTIPTRNEEKYLENALSSLSGKGFSGDFEIILGDAGSTDRTAEIAKKYNAKIVVEPKLTIGAGRQKAGLAASGDIIAIADADVTFEPGWLAEIAKPFEDPKVVAVIGKIVPADGNFLEHLMCDPVLSSFTWLLNSLGMTYCYGMNMAVRASAFRQIGGFDRESRNAEDTDLVMRIKKLGKVRYAPNAVVRFSMRRVRKWGYPKYLWFHTTNFIGTNISGKGHEVDYEPIR